jgi:amino acid adenylation domain-containing protein
MFMMIDELFALQAARTPDAVAVSFEGDRLTYRELEAAVDRLAADLRGAGVGPGALVALFLDRSLELVVAMLGALKAGGAYLPLDPTHPGARLAYILADAEPRVLLTRPGGPPAPPAFSGRTIAVDAKAPSAAPAPGDAPPPLRSVNDLAYVIYTSGSTGAPKGVAIEHRSVVNMLQSMLARPGLGAADVLVAVTTPTFDISVLEIFLPLICGARVVVASDAVARDGVALAALLESAGATVLQATPSGLRMLIDSGWRGAARLKILCGGEAWPEQLAAELLERCGSLWNMYGPTETTVWSAVAKIEAGQPVRIGRPIAETALYVLDGGRQLLPVGVTGELYIGGAGLARGYFNRDELTRERFVRDPYSQTPGARMYRTGDLVRRRADGTLEFYGRADHQVKIRGHRVELGEIEAKLADRPGVQQAVVVARDDAPGGFGLVAYYVPAPEGAPPIDDLRRALQEALPAYMVPAAFVVLDRFPLTPNGKVDRKALPAPTKTKIETESYVAPTTNAEHVLAGIFRNRLSLERVGTQDNFFDLGGHSLLAVRVIGEINKALKVRLSILEMYQNPTIERLARVLEQKHHVPSKSRLVPLRLGHTGLSVYFIGARPAEYRIAQLIGEDRAVFGVDMEELRQAVLSGKQTMLPTIEQLGASCGDLVLAHAGSSPCVIAGYSFDGKVAFEAACALQRAGGNVACALLIDAYAFTGRGATLGPLLRSLRWIWRGGAREDTGWVIRLSVALRNYGRLLWWLLAQIPRVLKGRLSLVGGRLAQGPLLSSYLDKDGASIEQKFVNRFLRASAKSFHPRPLDSSGVLIRAEYPTAEMPPGYDFSNGWSNLFTRGLEVVQAAGDHLSIVAEANTATLTQQINAALRRYDPDDVKRGGPNQGSAKPRAAAGGLASPVLLAKIGRR